MIATATHPFREGATLPLETVSAADLATWIAASWARVDRDDVETDRADALGSNDVPRLSLTERTRTPAEERAYGAWGCVREVRWETGPRGAVVEPTAIAERAAAFVAAFVERNGRVVLSLRRTFLAGGGVEHRAIGAVS